MQVQWIRIKVLCESALVFCLLFCCVCFAETGASERDRSLTNGRIAMEEGAYDQAVQCFNDAYVLNRADLTVAKYLLQAYEKLALQKIKEKEFAVVQQYLRTMEPLCLQTDKEKGFFAEIHYRLAKGYEQCGRMRDAQYYFEKAIAYNPQKTKYRRVLGTMLMQHGTELFAARNYHGAQKYFREALPYFTDKGILYEYLGDTYYYQGNIKRAESRWRKALDEYGGTHAPVEKKTVIENKLASLSEDKEIKKDHSQTSSLRFLIEYDTKDMARNESRVLKMLQDAYSSIGRDFHFFPREKVHVLIYDSDDFGKKIGDEHEYIGALYDGKMRLPTIEVSRKKQKVVSLKRFKAYVWHEYTHTIVHALSGGRAPRWLNEGLAEYEENKVEAEDMAAFRKLVRADQCLSLATIQKWQFSMTNSSQTHLHYVQAFSMVDYLVRRYRMQRIKQLLQKLQEGVPFESAFQATFHVSLNTFYDRWKQSVR